MDYMLLIHSDENVPVPTYGQPGFDEMMAGWLAFNQTLIDGGHWIAAANLRPTSTATVVAREWGGEATITDGPYAETKEQLGGFYLFSADDLDQAIEFAQALPLPAGSIEIRPVSYRPDAPRPDAA